MSLKDHHDYDLAQKEWTSIEKEDPKLERCHYCKIPLVMGGYQRPVSYDDHYQRFDFLAGRRYGHPACILRELTEEVHIHYLRAVFLLHKLMRLQYRYEQVLVKAPPREILQSFGGPVAFQVFGEILATQEIYCDQIHEPIYIPEISATISLATPICPGQPQKWS